MIVRGRPVVEPQLPRFLGNRGGGNVEIRNDAHVFGQLITRLANVDIHRYRVPLGDCVPERRIKDLEWHVEIVVVVLPIVRHTQFCKLVKRCILERGDDDVLVPGQRQDLLEKGLR